MKPDEKIRNYQSTVTGDSVKMSIDESATAHIMDVLTKLYADPELAVIREYSTNALDSHVEAGVTRPIEVTLPTQLAPFLTIRDYGIGLDADGIRDIYSLYGTSTKRGSNEAVGMLGLGCKSALSYTDQFTLTGFKDGYRTEVLISRDEDGAGSMAIVSEGLDESYLGNGVKVQIPVKRENDVATKAWEFFRFWQPGTVLVNGKQPRRIGGGEDVDEHSGGPHQNIWLDDHTLLTTEVGESFVVMGSVAYPLVEGEAPLFATTGNNRRYNSATMRYEYGSPWNAVCFVDIGEVNFAPSRESLMTTKRTKAKMAELRDKIEALRDQAIRDQIAGAPNAKTAQDLLRMGMTLGFKKDDAIWQGQVVVLQLTRKIPTNPVTNSQYSPDNLEVEALLKYTYLHVNGNSYARKAGERSTSIDLTTPQRIFVGFDGKVMTNVKRAKLELWCQQQDPQASTREHMVFVDELTATEKFWTSGWNVHNWADVAAIELPKTVQADGSTTRLKGSYDVLLRGRPESGIPAAKIDEYSKLLSLIWTHGNHWSAKSNTAVRVGAIKADDAIIVCLPANRVDKFCRDFPKAKQLNDAAQAAAERWVKQQKPEVVIASQVKEALRGYNCISELDPAKLDDPALIEALRLFRLDTSSYQEGVKKFTRWLGVSKNNPKVSVAEKALAKYPLLASMGGYGKPNKEHLHLYINAAYLAEKGA